MHGGSEPQQGDASRGPAEPEGTGSPERAASRQFTIFAVLFAIAALFHQARVEDFSSVFPDLAVSIAAIALLLRPSSTGRFLVLLALEAAAVATDLPAVVNHSLFVALTAVGVFVALTAARLTRQPWLRDRGALFLRLAPVVRVEVVLLYVFAGLAKVNASFFDPALSCGNAMIEELLTTGPLALYADWQATPAIVGAVLVELGLPLLLALRRTRLVGVFVGVGFHTALAFAGHVSRGSRWPSTSCSCRTTSRGDWTACSRHGQRYDALPKRPGASRARPPLSRCPPGRGSPRRWR